MKWLLPREHGAYGQLGVPLAAALALGDFSGAAWALAGATVAGFLAHEPLLLLLGQRGQNARDRDGPSALGWLAGLGALGAALFALGVYGLPAGARLLLGVPLLLSAAVGAAVLLRREKTAPGEVTAALALSSWALPVAAAGSASFATALSCWLVFAAMFVGATGSVRGLIAQSKGGSGRAGLAAGALLPVACAAVATALAAGGRVPRFLPLALGPSVALGLALWVRPPRARHLRTLGWGLVAASLATGVLVVLALR